MNVRFKADTLAAQPDRALPEAAAEPDPGAKPRGMVLQLIVGFWVAHYLLLTARLVLLGGGGLDPMQIEIRRVAPTLLNIAISYGIYLVLSRVVAKPFWLKVGVATALVVPAAFVYSVFNDFTQYYWFTSAHVSPYSLTMLWTTVFPFIGSFAACTALLMALTYSFDVREKERRLARIGMMAREAQLLALRYQLNPHFLFNTLNSISSMLWQNEVAQAEAMIVRLSDFLRKTLEVDPTADVILADEIELQQLYLAIEQIRFSERLDAHFEISEGAARARVPSLILQPLVENAVRYAVATSPLRTRVSVRAADCAGRLILKVEDDGRGALTAGGAGVGLANVKARILARFGVTATVVAGPRTDGGYQVTLNLPLEFGGG